MYMYNYTSCGPIVSLVQLLLLLLFLYGNDNDDYKTKEKIEPRIKLNNNSHTLLLYTYKSCFGFNTIIVLKISIHKPPYLNL